MVVFLISLSLSLALCALARPVLRRMGVIDKPNARSSHTVPTVRGLGVGIVAAVIIGWILGGLAGSPVVITMTVAGLVLSVVSFTDDMRPVSPLVRFGCHAFAAIAVLAVLCLGWHDRPEPVLLAVMLPIGFLFIAGYTNAFNFMDGINGIAGFQGALTALGTAGLMVLDGAPWDSAPVIAALVVAGASAGFLPHNFPRARGFMGDVASATLGYWLSAIVLWCVCERGLHLLVPLSMLHANFILDTGVTLVRRKLRGEKLSQAHREHFYQRLVRSGASHPFVTLTEAAGQLLVFGLMVLFLKYAWPVKVTALGVSVALWAVYFAYAEKRFRKSTASA